MTQPSDGSSDDVMSYMRGMEDRLTARLDSVDDSLAEATADVSDIKSDVAQVKTDVAQANADLAQVKTDVAEIKDDVSQVKRVIGETRIETQIAVDAVADLYGRLEGT